MRPYTYRILQCFLASVFLLSCSDNLSEAPETGAAQGLSLAFNLNGGSAESSPGSDGLKENTVNSLDVLFVKGTAVEKHFSYNNSQLSSGSVQIAGNDWKDDFQGEYEVYLVANYDGDLSSVTTKSQLFATVDQDENITKAEGEQSVDAGSKYTGKSFLMDGKTTFNAGSDYGPTNQHTIDVNLSRAAAKITVNLAYGNGFLQTESGGSRSIVSVQKKLVRYVNEAKIVADGGTIPFADLHGNSDNTGFSYANVTEGEEPAGRKDVLYTYCYPNDWTDDIEGRETYLLLNIPYTEGGDQGDLINNYYKIPVRISGVTQQLSIERNTEYTIDVNINRVGSTLLEKPTELVPEISVKNWVAKDVNVSDQNTPNYLVLNMNDFEMRNIDKASVTFSSSSALTAVDINKVYYINKDDQETEIADHNVNVTYDKSLKGLITVTSPVPVNSTIRYIQLTVKNNEGNTEVINISQYPLDYVVPIPGVYAYSENMTNNTYQIYKNQEAKDRITDQVSFNPGTFFSKVFHEGKIKWAKATYNGSTYTIQPYYEMNTLGNNHRMYLMFVTSVQDGVTISRPQMEKNTDGESVAVSSQENNSIVSPAFMLNSQLGELNSGSGLDVSWEEAREHCSKYVEVIDNGSGYVRVLDDWRLPSTFEINVFVKIQQNQTDVVHNVFQYKNYWTLQDGVKSEDLPYDEEGGNYDKTNLRCVRDVTPEDLQEFRENGFKY